LLQTQKISAAFVVDKCHQHLSLTVVMTSVPGTKMSVTFVADTLLNCKLTFFDGRPITASVTEDSHAHLPSTCLLRVFFD